MTMAEYIEREALLMALGYEESWRKNVLEGSTFDIILKFPAADVAPVVRCRECRHYREFRTKRYKNVMRLCYRMGKHDMEYPVKPDDFCSYGKRKEGAD